MDERTTERWYTRPVADVARQLESDVTRGLSAAEAARRLVADGANALAQARSRSAWSILLAQFRSLLVLLLIAATAIAFFTGDALEGIAILVVIVLNAAIGFLTEWKAEQALSALARQAVRTAQVIRDGTEREIPAADVVRGDLVVLATGERTPADGRVVESVHLQIAESALTGESQPVTKHAEPLANADAVLGDRVNMAYLGTTITSGRGRLLVTATASRTEVGQIGTLIDSATTRATPLEQKLVQIGRLLIVVVLALCAVIVLVGWLRGIMDFWHMLEMGLSLAIAAVPEGLPAVATMTLALGMQRMAKQRALVRRLPAVETLGCTTVICTDKTGTLTKNEMTVRTYAFANQRIAVGGTGYAADGTFTQNDAVVDVGTDERLRMALRIGLLCNDATIDRAQTPPTVLGDPTEAALIVAAEKGAMRATAMVGEFPRVSELPFASESKRMVTVHRTPEGRRLACIKGSPAVLLAASREQQEPSGTTALTPESRRSWEASNIHLADEALRVLALAYRDLPDGYTEADLSRDLTFVGLVGMSDPLRPEAKSAIATCRVAGIRTVMITGDQIATASAIAREVGIDRALDGVPLRTVHGRDLTALDDAGWQRVVKETAVFARVSPHHKLQIVTALQQQGEVVAMTGDGVNDAPALKQADIGIAMGITGSDVANENADMVITDDNFASIVGAVEQGRVIYGNIIRFLHYLLSCNLSEILTVFGALMIGWPLPLAALQILWLNLVTDILPAFALALEPSGQATMQHPPRDPNARLLTPHFLGLIGWQGLLLAGVTLLAFGVGLARHGSDGAGLRLATTMAFMTLAVAQIMHTFSARSQADTIFNRRLFTNGWLWASIGCCLLLQVAAVSVPLLQRVLHTAPPSGADWAVIVSCALAPLALIELVKLVQRLAARNATA